MESGIDLVLEAVRRNGSNTEAYRSLGAIRVTLHPKDDLLLFNYTDKATFAGQWNEVERVSRGLIIHWPTATVAARPFDKFFNLGEKHITDLPSGPFEATAKLDGSLGILYRCTEGYAIATRGNFVSKQAGWATAYLRARYNLMGLPENVTLLFEIIYPDNRVIIDYGESEALYLIGARKFDGYDYNYKELTRLAEQFGLPIVESVKVTSLAELEQLANNASGIEGWVLRFEDGSRVKVKTIEYIRIAQILNRLTPARVRDVLLLDSQADWDEYVMDLPEELYQKVEEIAAIIKEVVLSEEKRLNYIFQTALAEPLAKSRKDFALAVKANFNADSKFLFAMLGREDIKPLLLRRLDLARLKFPEDVWQNSAKPE